MYVDEDWCVLWVISVYDSDQMLKLSSDTLSTQPAPAQDAHALK